MFDKKWKRLTVLVIAVFILSMIPIFLMMKYAHPMADEFTEPVHVYRAITEGRGLLGVLKGAWKNMVYNYFHWQGTYTAEFVMALNPHTLGEQYYFTGPVIVCVFYLVCHFYFFYVLLCRVFSMKKYGWLIISSMTALLGYNFMPDPAQGIYWYESAVYYMGLYGLGLASLAFTIRILMTEQQGKAVAFTVLACITAFLTAGASMQSGLGFIFLYILIAIAAFILNSRNKVLSVLPALFMIGGFMIAVLAPGNFIRGKEAFAGIGVFMTIYKSIHEACVLISEWTSMYMVAIFAGLVVPLCFITVKDTKFRFDHPILFTIYMCGVFSVQFAPFYYTYDMLVPLRAANPVYCSFLMLAVLVILYWCGWLRKHILIEDLFSEAQKERLGKWYFSWGTALIICIFSLGCVASDRMTYLTSVSATVSLITGQAQAFDAEMDEREAVYLANRKTDNDVIIPAVKNRPYLLYIQDEEVRTETSYWINTGISKYYQFKSLTLKETENN
ncbi:MAG: DUF6056 family protein [Solobacterium sp.]|nr:DUF6056 family protein [Solobacterium sp.]